MNLLTEIKEGLSISWASILSNKMRSALATLGVVIGIVTVTLMATAIEGLNRAFMKSISIVGADVFYVQKSDWMVTSHEMWMRMQKRRPITMDECHALERLLPNARAIAPTADVSQPVTYKNKRSDSVRVVGTTEQLLFTSSVGVGDGRFLSAPEVEGGRPVCVVGTQVASNLFHNVSPVGSKIKVGGRPCEVVGVLEPQGSFLGAISMDNQIFVPLKWFETAFRNRPEIEVQVKASSIQDIEDSKEELRGAMRRARSLAPSDPDDFSINQQDQLVEMFHKLGGTIAAVGLFITGLSLFVGGIGIMNIMFVSVAERTREIGIRKAIGAKRRTILVQFLIESACICLIGGCIGLFIAWPITLGIQKFLPAALSIKIVGVAVLVSLVTGVLSGFFPAWRAARMNPVDALRNE